jgi:4-amino-4-deoxy-L-arabinose transferase-like glycosyltransferase
VNQKRARWALVILCWLAFVLRVIRLDFQSLWRDEVDTLLFAAAPLREVLQTFIQPGQNGPLYFLVLRPWLELVGQSEFSLRFFSVVFGVLIVPLIYRLACRLFAAPMFSSATSRPDVSFQDGSREQSIGPRMLALLVAFLAATSPYLIWYSQEGKMYAFVAFLAVLSMECYLTALEEGGWQRWCVYMVATTAMFYAHMIAALMIPVQILIFLGIGRQDRYKRWKPWLASMALLTLPYLPMLVWQIPLILDPAETGYRFSPLHEMLFSLAASYSLGVMQGSLWLRLAPFVGLFLAGWVYFAEQRRPRTVSWVLGCWLLVPIASFFLLTLIRPLYTARYLIFVLPAFLLLLAAGVSAVARRSRLLAGLLLLSLVVVNGWGLWLQATRPLKTDFRAATRYVASRLEREDLVLFQIPHGRYSFDYYFPIPEPKAAASEHAADYLVFLPQVSGGGEPYRWAEGLYTNHGMSPGEVDWRMAEMTVGSPAVWLIASEASMWDERNLVQAWLDDQGYLEEQAHFVRVSVFKYKMPQDAD